MESLDKRFGGWGLSLYEQVPSLLFPVCVCVSVRARVPFSFIVFLESVRVCVYVYVTAGRGLPGRQVPQRHCACVSPQGHCAREGAGDNTVNGCVLIFSQRQSSSVCVFDFPCFPTNRPKM
ncbi:MAG: hypothetical protein P4L40_02815 [Terracidiphilus sp.]|nr:hypothetical protein [Terracidiphilus sp.]